MSGFGDHPVEQEGLAISTRESLLNEAVRLFDKRGFRSVSNEEIGEAAGTSGPNIYRHFSSKTDLLVAAVYRAGERRRLATSEALAQASGPRELLTSLLRGYIRFALGNRHLLGVQARRTALIEWTASSGRLWSPKVSTRSGAERGEPREELSLAAMATRRHTAWSRLAGARPVEGAPPSRAGLDQ